MTNRFDDFQRHLMPYFNQDWQLDAVDTMEVVRNFIRTTYPDEQRAVLRDIEIILSQPLDERTLHDTLLRDYRLYYDPYDDEITMREWLTRVRDVICEELALPPK